MAVDPGDELGRRGGSRQPHPVDSQRLISRRAYRVDHGMVVRQQFCIRNMPPHFDIQIEREPTPTADAVEQRGDPLGVLMIRRHPGPHQAVRGGQCVEDVDAHPGLCEQFVGGVHTGRP